MLSHDRIPDASRWRSCVHEAGHVALVLLTGTALKRAVVYRHYSSATREGGSYGSTSYVPAASQAHEALIEGAGIVAERLFTGTPARTIVQCDDRLPEDDETLTLCADLLAVHAQGVLRVAAALHQARGSVTAPALARAFGAFQALTAASKGGG